MFASEREVADVLDSLGVHWEYEPTMFPLEVSNRGIVKEGFRPDFFLPAYNFYVEVTKARQSNTTRKNRKVRALREKYPEVGIELIYAAHFENLYDRVLEILNIAKSLRESA